MRRQVSQAAARRATHWTRSIGPQLRYWADGVSLAMRADGHVTSNAQVKRRSGWSACSGNNGEAMPEQARSAERPSEPQANGLTELLGIEAP